MGKIGEKKKSEKKTLKRRQKQDKQGLFIERIRFYTRLLHTPFASREHHLDLLLLLYFSLSLFSPFFFIVVWAFPFFLSLSLFLQLARYQKSQTI